MTTSLPTPVQLLTQRSIAWADANKLRDNFNSGLIEECETKTFAWVGTKTVAREWMLILVDVNENTAWLLPLDRESNVLTKVTLSKE